MTARVDDSKKLSSHPIASKDDQSSDLMRINYPSSHYFEMIQASLAVYQSRTPASKVSHREEQTSPSSKECSVSMRHFAAVKSSWLHVDALNEFGPVECIIL